MDETQRTRLNILKFLGKCYYRAKTKAERQAIVVQICNMIDLID